MSNKRSINWRAELADGLSYARGETELFEVVAGAARDLGFEYCAYGMRQALPFTNPKTVMVNNYPVAWQQRYASEHYLMVDPTVAHGALSMRPVIWDEALFKNARGLWEDAHAHRLNVGWAQASRDALGVAGLLTLARSGDAITASELTERQDDMSWLAHAAHEALAGLHSPLNGAAAQFALTAREVEVLRWMADGKTSSDVATILNLSERTVNFHVANALLKLGAPNKTAAVVKAAMLRLI